MSKQFPEVNSAEFGMDTSKLKMKQKPAMVGSGGEKTKSGMNDKMTEKMAPKPKKLGY